MSGPGVVSPADSPDRTAGQADSFSSLPAVREPHDRAAAEPNPHGLPAHARIRLLPPALDALRSLASMVVLALFILTFIMQPFRIPSESMERTLLVGDFLLVNKMIFSPPGWFHALLPYRDPARGDVVVFRFPLDPTDYVVKRVIGVPGDRIRLANGVVYRDGVALHEPYAVSEPAYRDSFRDNFPLGTYSDPGVDIRWWRWLRANTHDGAITVPPGDYFVMGDNRNHSRDSRYWGFVPRSAMLGRPFLIYFSLREPSTTDVPALPDDTLGHDSGPVSGIVDFARWDRMFHIVR